MAIITLGFCIVYSTLEGISTKYGMGWYESQMSAKMRSDHYKWVYITAPFYLTCLFGYKQAILLLYLRLFKTSQTFIYVTKITMLFVFAYISSNLWTRFFGCSPQAKYWDTEIPGHCVSFRTANLIFSALNIFSDLFIMILPLPMIWNMQLSWRGKVGVSLVFLSGAIAGVVAMMRTIYVVYDTFSGDRLAGRQCLWAILEINTGLICSCTPAFKSLLKHIFSRPWFANRLRRVDNHWLSAAFEQAPIKSVSQFKDEESDGRPQSMSSDGHEATKPCPCESGQAVLSCARYLNA
ncbi:hypothetical protein MMC07_007678 [Pseudocyphellaria aurata]|nr:hypothetical protein [Pseudocyphellaria aurata]